MKTKSSPRTSDAKSLNVTLFTTLLSAVWGSRNFRLLFSVFETALETVRKMILNTFRPLITERLLFGGKVKEEYRNKDALKEITDRYKDNINDVNRKIGLTLTFTIVALYVYFILPKTDTVKIPFTELSVSRELWISVAPAISYGLNILVIVSFLWFMTLRNGIKMLIGHSQNNNEELSDEGKSLSAISDLPKNSSLEKQASNQSFADLTNILLKGIVGDLWMIFRTRKVLISRLNYIWYVPLLLLILLVILSPTIISLFFTYQLFLTQNIALGTVYVIMFFPISFLSLMLFGMVGLLGDTESL